MSLEGQLLGRYRVLRLIGSGGMGEVYLADDPTINRQVAIKVVHTEATDHSGTGESKGAARLFQREAKAIAMLDHTYILPLYFASTAGKVSQETIQRYIEVQKGV